MTKPVKHIAELLDISVEEAYVFCSNVQKHFKGSKPPFKVIAQELEKGTTNSALDVAQRISPGLTYTPPSRRARQGSQYLSQSSGNRQGRFSHIEAYERDTPTIGLTSNRPKNPLRSRTRLEQGKAKSCPHGVPFFRKCAICDPEGFAAENG